MAPAALELSGVRVRFDGLVALDDVSLEVAQDHVVGVIGPNGAGKTTLFNVVCGFVRPDEGELRRNGRLLRRHRAHDLAGLGIGRTLQGLGLFPGLTVAENVIVGAASQAPRTSWSVPPPRPGPGSCRRCWRSPAPTGTRPHSGNAHGPSSPRSE